MYIFNKKTGSCSCDATCIRRLHVYNDKTSTCRRDVMRNELYLFFVEEEVLGVVDVIVVGVLHPDPERLRCRAMYLVQTTHTLTINSERQEILGFPAVKSVATGDKTTFMHVQYLPQ